MYHASSDKHQKMIVHSCFDSLAFDQGSGVRMNIHMMNLIIIFLFFTSLSIKILANFVSGFIMKHLKD